MWPGTQTPPPPAGRQRKAWVVGRAGTAHRGALGLGGGGWVAGSWATMGAPLRGFLCRGGPPPQAAHGKQIQNKVEGVSYKLPGVRSPPGCLQTPLRGPWA